LLGYEEAIRLPYLPSFCQREGLPLTKIGAIERRYRLASYAFPPYGRVGVSDLSEKTKERFHMIGKRSNRALPVASGIGMRQEVKNYGRPLTFSL
jgi:hypothetical protein